MTTDWLAIHIYYTASTRPLVKDCVRPLTASLWADGLLENYFFINYWVEGSHLRLRLLPSSTEAAVEVRRRAEADITAFLKGRPALYDGKGDGSEPTFSLLFDMEFSAEERQQYLDVDGNMRRRDTNTFSYEAYEPEYGKYGGPAGVELAEWHFRHSSDLVMRIGASLNTHMRTVLLGTAAQLMMVISTVFLREQEATRDYLQQYHDFWGRALAGVDFVREIDYDQAYGDMAESVERRFADIRAAHNDGTTGDLSDFLSDWFDHCVQLRARVVDLAVSGKLVLRSWDGTRDETVTEPEVALLRLLSPYMHMTNNRLQVTFGDEAYLAHVLARALGAAPLPPKTVAAAAKS